MKNNWALTILAVLAAGCGAQPYQESVQGGVGNIPSSILPTAPDTGSGTNTGTVEALYPTYTGSFAITGSGGAQPTYTATINTDTVLKIRIKAGLAGKNTGSNFSANYGCVTYTVKVMGETVATKVLSPGGTDSVCPGAPTEEVIDFSHRLVPGHGAVAIEISSPQTNFQCRDCYANPWNYYAYPYGPYSCNLYCPVRNALSMHVATGTLEVETNNTSGL